MGEIDFIGVPHTATLIPHFVGENITITPGLLGRTIEDILRKRRL